MAGGTASTAGAAAGVWGGGAADRVSGEEAPSEMVRCRSSSVRCRLTVCGVASAPTPPGIDATEQTGAGEGAKLGARASLYIGADSPPHEVNSQHMQKRQIYLGA